MGLYIPLVDGLVAEFQFNDHIGGGKALFDITLGELDMGCDVALFVGALTKFSGRQVFVEQRGVFGHGLLYGHNRR